MKSAEYRIHYIDNENDVVVAQLFRPQVPRVGDEVRFSGNRYYTVILVVWVEDEPMLRANVGLKKIV